MKRWIAGLLLALSCAAGPVTAAEPDWSGYAGLLRDYVRAETREGVRLNWVDYSGLKRDRRFVEALQTVAQFSPAMLANREEKLAFYINAYNLMAVKVVLDHWPLQSIRDAGNLFKPVWKAPAGKVAGQMMSLGEIEHEVLRPMGEARIHMAIVCASISCPDLRPEPYYAATLDTQLDDQTRHFLDNPHKGLIRTDGVLRVSKIFDWFEEDFAAQYGDLRAFFAKYQDLPASASIKPGLPYNWSLNGE